jgi:hypothetical protein
MSTFQSSFSFSALVLLFGINNNVTLCIESVMYVKYKENFVSKIDFRDDISANNERLEL